jgi:lipoyl synthase
MLSFTLPMPTETQSTRLPDWVRRSIGTASQVSTVQKIIRERGIHTICEEGRCPNRAECYSQKTATFLLMGPVCTRACAFCQVASGKALPLDPQEPEKVAESVQLLGLNYVVLTSVARDDLPDQGASWFCQTMAAIRARTPHVQIEVLTPDFRADFTCLQKIVEAKPVCFNHNIETVRRLSAHVRRGATYDRTLLVLGHVKTLDTQMPTKSGLMLGHGETEPEIIETLQDLRSVGCDRLTLGQYLQPSQDHLPVQKYWTPEEFEHLGTVARTLGFAQVRSGPLVRSSYHASEMA